ncbi:MAG: 4Fe-4S binding protein [Chlorobi bacterium]|nr:4Fe-4S binding protein [Chlorobiota bacterium]
MLLCLWIGWEFIRFYQTSLDPAIPPTPRPPGVEGFLPISALMTLWYFLQTGILHTVHPAGMVILVAIILMSLVFKKAFCSWMCPVGFLSENIGEFGKKLFKRNFVLPVWLDIPLRSLKYLMLGFLIMVVFFQMSAQDLRAFLDSPYNKVADVKMLLFFARPSATTIYVITGLAVLSLFVKNFWCRFLCPYGALLGFVGLFSPFRITRNDDACTDCGKCAKVCPSAIKVDKVKRVWSDECTTCLECVDVCPVGHALEVKAHRKFKGVKPVLVMTIVVLIFLLTTGFGMLTGYWNNSITPEEYSRRIQEIDKPIYDHNYGYAPPEPSSPQTAPGEIQ